MYTKCIDCGRLGKTCSGPDFYLLSAEELIAWCKRRKEFLHLSNAKIAEIAAMPRGTVDNLFAGTHTDYRYESIRPVLKVLIGRTVTEEMCNTASADNSEIANLKSALANAESENTKMKSELDRIRTENEYLKTTLNHEQKQAERNESYLHEQIKELQALERSRKRVIFLLLVALVGILCAIIAVLAWDKMNPHIGWFRGLNIFGSTNITGGI